MDVTKRYQIHHLATVDSTNDYLKAMAGAPEWTCVTADRQTAGRGRQDRHWHSAAGEGLYLSILLRPAADAPHLPLLSLTAAVAVAETLRDEGVPGVDIKWPNDLLIGERKVCGILIESAGHGAEATRRVVVGIGVNLNQAGFPAPLDETATSCRLATGRAIDHDAFRDALLERFHDWYERWRGGEAPAILRRWEELSAQAHDRLVRVDLAGETLVGVTAGLDARGALRLRLADGSHRTVMAGEVSRLRSI